MNVLISPDKFRGSLTAIEVCDCIRKGVIRAIPEAKISTIPLADGGEGTLKILTDYSQGQLRQTYVSDPIGRKILASWSISGDEKTAFIEMAQASGLDLLEPENRNPLYTSTFGTGELISAALEAKVQNIVIGIGGSATNDAGMGMAAALGYQFYDINGELLEPMGANLIKVARIDTSMVSPRLHQTTFYIACDVTNPLYGETGAAYVYAPQKGADSEAVLLLDQALRHFSAVVNTALSNGEEVAHLSGAGAAGGLGAGGKWFLNAILREGTQLIFDYTGLKQLIYDADLVITGEGKVDSQTLQGKVVKGLADVCANIQIPLAVLCGTSQISIEEASEAGISYLASIIPSPMSLEEAQNKASILLEEAAYYLANIYKLAAIRK